MRLFALIAGEFVLLFASVLVFRSAWLLLDEYLGNSNLVLLLVVGVVLTVVGLVFVNYEVKCELQKQNKTLITANLALKSLSQLNLVWRTK